MVIGKVTVLDVEGSIHSQNSGDPKATWEIVVNKRDEYAKLPLNPYSVTHMPGTKRTRGIKITLCSGGLSVLTMPAELHRYVDNHFHIGPAKGCMTLRDFCRRANLKIGRVWLSFSNYDVEVYTGPVSHRDRFLGCELISQCVGEFESKKQTDHNWNAGEDVYSQSVSKMGAANLQKMTSQDVVDIVQPYLRKWGQMQRIVDRTKGWQSSLADLIRKRAAQLQLMRGKDLAVAPVGSVGIISQCFDDFAGCLKPVAAAKTLHLICPRFLPAWDNPIAGVVLESVGHKRGDFLNGADYCVFMQSVSKLLDCYGMTIRALAQKHNQEQLKIVDEFLWWLTHNPLSILS